MIRKIFLLTIILCSLGSTCLAFMQKEPEPVLRIRAIDVPKEATVRVMGSQDQWECLYLGEYRIRVNIAEYDEETKTLNVAAHILKYKSKFVCVDEFTLKEKKKGQSMSGSTRSSMRFPSNLCSRLAFFFDVTQ